MFVLRTFAGSCVHQGAGSRGLGVAVPDEPTAPTCPTGNLLRGRPRTANDAVGGARANDGAIVSEGADWNGPRAARIESGAGNISFDLGAPVHVGQVWVQADANDVYVVQGSLDGQQWFEVGAIPIVDGHGLRARSIATNHEVRHLRIGEPEGDGLYSLSEVAAYCDPVPDPTADMRVVVATAAPPATSWRWDDTTSARWEGVLAVLGFGALTALARWPDRRALAALLAVVGVLGWCSFFNFGSLHFSNELHDWDYTHYHLGARFFPELGYDNLYRCIAVADAEDGLRKRVETRRLTNLETNVIESGKTALVDPAICKDGFTEARWQAFRADVRFWRERQSAKRWDDLQLDHGFNATPVWTLLGHGLADVAPMSTVPLWVLAALDPLFLVAAFALCSWGFGWRATAVVLLVFGTNFPSRFYWTGGSFLRFDWLFWLFAGAVALRRDRPGLAGAAFAYAAWLRLFPAWLFAGPLLAALDGLWRTRTLATIWTRFFGGATAATMALVGMSIVAFGPAAWPDFVDNTVKHQETPLTNHMGLRTALSWRPEDAGRNLRDNKLTDPWLPWKEARLENWREAKPIGTVIGLGALVLLWRVARRSAPWVAAVAGLGFVPFGVELTCYYYAFLAVFALLWAADTGAGVLLLALTALTQFLAWAPIPGMAGWMDEQYVAMSVATCVAVLWVWWRLGGSK